MSQRNRKRSRAEVAPPPSPPAPAVNRKQQALICLLLAAATLLVYAQVAHFAFINYDDPDYVTSNFHVRAGLTGSSVLWALTSGYAGNWFPLTWLSHMADYQFFGLRSGPHHLTSLLLHLLSTLLLFLTLRRMTGAPWPSALTAFIFGTHPLHVESVAWIAERKDVLCAFFWMLTLWSYARYVERPGRPRYLLALVFFSFGLMSKPMIVTLPFVLLLLDYWPLRRPWKTRRVIFEKIQFLALSAIASTVTFLVQRSGGAVIPLGEISLPARIANALTSYLTYIFQTLVPVKLAAFYPFPDSRPLWQGALAGIVLIAISLVVLRSAHARPYLTVGWLWYLGTLVPVIGLVQVGNQAHADRYTYVPMIGLSIMLAWGAMEIVARWPKAKPAIVVTGTAACIACVALAWTQARYWSDSASLFRHAIDVTDGNYVAWRGLGQALKDQGRLEDAAAADQRAVDARPRDPDSHSNLGEVLLNLGRIGEAETQIDEALRLKPDLPEAHVNLGAVYSRLGKVDQAAAEYREALRLDPASAAAHTGAAAVLEDQGRKDQARAELREGIRLNPDYAPAHYNLGRLLGAAGDPAAAAQQFAEAVRLQPDDAPNRLNLGIALASQGKLDEATAEFRTAVRLDPGYASAHFNLGTALAQSGRIDEAIAEFAEAVRLKPDFSEARQSLERALSVRNGAAR